MERSGASKEQSRRERYGRFVLRVYRHLGCVACQIYLFLTRDSQDSDVKLFSVVAPALTSAEKQFLEHQFAGAEG
jgi:hypothetical protein